MAPASVPREAKVSMVGFSEAVKLQEVLLKCDWVHEPARIPAPARRYREAKVSGWSRPRRAAFTTARFSRPVGDGFVEPARIPVGGGEVGDVRPRLESGDACKALREICFRVMAPTPARSSGRLRPVA